MSSSSSIYLLMLGSGLFGGFGHCIGMCGPLIATYTIAIGGSPIERFKPYIIYHSGRVMSYSLIGGLMGLAGSFVTGLRFISQIQTIAMVLAGLLMIIMGLSILRFIPFRLPSSIFPFPFFLKLMKGISESGNPGSLFPIGILNGFIPCGLSYTAFIAGAGVGAGEPDPAIGFLKGLFLLFVFGLGTMPTLFILSQIVSKAVTLRQRFYHLSGLFMVVSGMIFIYRAFMYARQ